MQPSAQIHAGAGMPRPGSTGAIGSNRASTPKQASAVQHLQQLSASRQAPAGPEGYALLPGPGPKTQHPGHAPYPVQGGLTQAQRPMQASGLPQDYLAPPAWAQQQYATGTTPQMAPPLPHSTLPYTQILQQQQYQQQHNQQQQQQQQCHQMQVPTSAAAAAAGARRHGPTPPPAMTHGPSPAAANQAMAFQPLSKAPAAAAAPPSRSQRATRGKHKPDAQFEMGGLYDGQDSEEEGAGGAGGRGPPNKRKRPASSNPARKRGGAATAAGGGPARGRQQGGLDRPMGQGHSLQPGMAGSFDQDAESDSDSEDDSSDGEDEDGDGFGEESGLHELGDLLARANAITGTAQANSRRAGQGFTLPSGAGYGVHMIMGPGQGMGSGQIMGSAGMGPPGPMGLSGFPPIKEEDPDPGEGCIECG